MPNIYAMSERWLLWPCLVEFHPESQGRGTIFLPYSIDHPLYCFVYAGQYIDQPFITYNSTRQGYIITDLKSFGTMSMTPKRAIELLNKAVDHIRNLQQHDSQESSEIYKNVLDSFDNLIKQLRESTV